MLWGTSGWPGDSASSRAARTPGTVFDTSQCGAAPVRRVLCPAHATAVAFGSDNETGLRLVLPRRGIPRRLGRSTRRNASQGTRRPTPAPRHGVSAGEPRGRIAILYLQLFSREKPPNSGGFPHSTDGQKNAAVYHPTLTGISRGRARSALGIVTVRMPSL